MSVPSLSVVLPARNVEKFLRAAVDSILGQTFTDFELLIVDDGSTDGTAAIVASYRDPRVRMLKSEGTGLVDALNTGIRAARGELIARMDGDDVCRLQRFEWQVGFLNAHPDIIAVGGAIEEIDEEGRVLNPSRPFPRTHDAIREGLLHQRFVLSHPTLLFRKAAGLAVGLYDRRFPFSEDCDFLSRLVLTGHLANLPETVLSYRLTRGATSTLDNHKMRATALLVARMLRRTSPGDTYRPSEKELAWLETIRRSRSFEADAVSREAIYQYRVGCALVRAGRWREAIACYRAAAAKRPVAWLLLSLRYAFGSADLQTLLPRR